MSDTGTTIPLDAVRADGWFEQIGGNSPGFVQLCEIVGEPFVAFSIVIGVRITAIQLDRRSPDSSIVEFEIGESTEPQRLPLNQFRLRVSGALLGEDPPLPRLSEPPSNEEIQAYIGHRYILLAPLFGVELVSLILTDDEEEPLLAVGNRFGTHEVPLSAFREMVRDRIRREVEESNSQNPFAIDFNALDAAEEAAHNGDWEEVIAQVGPWPGPLSMLYRTPEGQGLGPDVRVKIGRGLALLSDAYSQGGRDEWAEDVLRLGVQWTQEGSAAGDLYLRFGQLHVRTERFGQGIGILRRALALGADRGDTMAELAVCFDKRESSLAALVCAEEAIQAGGDRPRCELITGKRRDQFGEAWTRFRELVPMSSPRSETKPPFAGDTEPPNGPPPGAPESEEPHQDSSVDALDSTPPDLTSTMPPEATEVPDEPTPNDSKEQASGTPTPDESESDEG